MKPQPAVPPHWPVLGVCGFGGSGKTTLIEALIPRLLLRGLSVAVLKHDAHGLSLDAPGKDTDRFFAAGATVVGRDPAQSFLRRSDAADATLRGWLELLLRDHDLVLVEGYKETPLPARVWLDSAPGESIPPEAGSFDLKLGRDDERPDRVAGFLGDWLPRQQQRRPLRAGLLIGGRSLRMGRAKATLLYRDRPWAELAADALRPHATDLVLLGRGPVPDALTDLPRLPDAPDAAGPLAGLLAALRWDPAADWLFAACDMPLLTAEALGWLLSHREPGRWAIVPRHAAGGEPEPLAAWYDARMLPILAAGDRAANAASHPKAFAPELASPWDRAWRSFNSPEDLSRLG